MTEPSDPDAGLTDATYRGCCKTGVNPTFRFEHNCLCPTPPCFIDDDSADVRVRVDNLGATAVFSQWGFTAKF